MANARTLNQILTELSPTYDSQINNLRQRSSLIPQQIAEEEKGLEARQTQAFGDILGGARRRGLGFSGIPLEEQARYTSTEFLPALARLRQSGREQALSLEDAVLGINERRDTLGQQIYQQEQDRAFQAEQARLNREAQERQAAQSRAAAASAMPTLGGYGNASQQAQSPAARFEQRGNGGAFYDANNKPITAAQYAKLTNTNLGNVLAGLVSMNDKSAQFAYKTLQSAPDQLEYQRRLSVLQRQYPYLLGGA